MIARYHRARKSAKLAPLEVCKLAITFEVRAGKHVVEFTKAEFANATLAIEAIATKIEERARELEKAIHTSQPYELRHQRVGPAGDAVPTGEVIALLYATDRETIFVPKSPLAERMSETMRRDFCQAVIYMRAEIAAWAVTIYGYQIFKP